MVQEDCRLDRREVLVASAGALSVPLVGQTATAASSDGTSTGSSPATYEPLGRVDVNGAKEAVTTPDGEHAFVATGTGFVTVDVSDPANPSIASATQHLTAPDGTDVRQVADVKYDDGRLLVPTAFQGRGPRGFFLFDVSDPTNPSQVGEWFPTPEHGNHNSFLHDGVAYLTGNTRDGPKVDMIDVAEPPFERVGTWQPGDWKEEWATPPSTAIHDLYVQGDYAYCAYWDAGTFTLDVSDPANPTFVSRVGDYSRDELDDFGQSEYVEPGGNDHYVTVNEDATLMAEGGESWDLEKGDDTGGPSGITLFDNSDKASPERLAHIDPPSTDDHTYSDGSTWTTSHNFDIHGDRLYASWYQGGVSVHDVSDPANPERIAWWADADDMAFWTAQLAVPGEFFVAPAAGSNGTGTTALLTFPDDAGGRMEAPPESVTWATDGAYPSADESTTTTQPTTTEPTATEPTTTEPTTVEPTTAEPTSTAPSEDGGTSAPGGSETATTTSDGEAVPGFGVLAALGALGAGAARVLRDDAEDDA